MSNQEGSYLSSRDMSLLKVEAILRLQKEKWGLGHDRRHDPEDWHELLLDRIDRSLDDHKQYLIIAAMAISAWESRPEEKE